MARTAYTGVSGATASIAAAPAVLSGIFVSSTGSSGTMVIYDNASETTVTTLIPEFALTAGYTNLGNVTAGNGIYIETNGSPIYTVLTLAAD